MKKYVIILKSAKETVGDIHDTIEDAKKQLEEFERDDMNMGYYERDSYEIVESEVENND